MMNAETSSLPSLIKATDVAALLKISRSMAYRLIQQGTIPSVRINHSVRVRSNDLEAFIEKNWSGWVDAASSAEA